MTLSDVELIEQYLEVKARNDFYTFRRLISPTYKVGWFYKDITARLHQYYNDLISGKRPKLIILAPPQHGKTEAITDFICWLVGKHPELKTFYASFSERLGVRANLKVQRILTRKRYKKIFKTRISEKRQIDGKYLRNKEVLEFIDETGYFRNTTVQGSITGETIDLGVIDDPIKGREAANSTTTREKTWDWFTDDFFTRFSEDAGLLVILTRWHIDDPAGRMIESFGDDIEVVKYKAIATEDEEYREEGEALFPEIKSITFLNERKKTMSAANFVSLYQQSPTIQDGEMFKYDWFKWWEAEPVIKEKSIFVDTAQKKGQRNDYTVAELWGFDGLNIYLLDMLRVKENAPEAQRAIEMFYHKHKDNKLKKMYIEDKSSGSTMIQVFRGKKMLVEAIQRNKDKEERASIFSGYIEMGRVYLNSKINQIDKLIDEAISFPNAPHDDTLDPMMDAIEKYCINPKPNSIFAVLQKK